MAVTRHPNTTCHVCGTAMYRRPWELKAGKGRYCTRACRNKAHPLPFSNFPPPKYGPNNPAWKGGVTYFKKKGNYANVKYVRAPEWALPMARKDGYIMEHRLLMAERCGFLLTRTEVVHHVDHDPTNNSLSNLELWPTNGSHKAAEHGRIVEGVANRVCLAV